MAKRRLSKVEDAYFFMRDVLDRQCGIFVWDMNLDGPGMVIDIKKTPVRFAIIVGGVRNLKHRMFILAHEFGHCVSFNIKNKTMYVRPRKNTCSEGEANKTAIKLVKAYDPKWEQEYKDLYNKMNEGNVRKKI